MKAKECRAGGCTRKTKTPYCFQHKDMAEPVTLDSYIDTLQRLRASIGGDVEVTVGGSTFDPANGPKLVQVVDTAFGTKAAEGRSTGVVLRRVLCLNY